MRTMLRMLMKSMLRDVLPRLIGAVRLLAVGILASHHLTAAV